MVTSAEANAIWSEPKVIAVNLVWRRELRNFRLEATILATTTGRTLSLRGYIGRKNRSFALLFKNIPIRKWTVHDRHRDAVSGQMVTQPHKHTWDDLHEDRATYLPTDMHVGDPNQELMDFLKECNITLRGAYRAETFFQIMPGGSSS